MYEIIILSDFQGPDSELTHSEALALYCLVMFSFLEAKLTK